MLRASYIAALPLIAQQFHQDDTQKQAPVNSSRKKPVKRKMPEGGGLSVIKRKPDDSPATFPPLKVRKAERSGACSKRPLRETAMADGLGIAPCDLSGSSADSSVQPVQGSLRAENRSGSAIVLPKGNHHPPLILTKKIESYEGVLPSQKPGRAEAARHNKFRCQVLGQGVYTARSTRPGAGEGLYAGMSLAPHVLVTECIGDIEQVPVGSKGAKRVWEKIGSRYELWSHLVEISDHQILRCIREPVSGSGGGSFANDSRPGKPNAEFIRIRDEAKGVHRVFIKSLRDIKAGEEITVSYGDGFWCSFKAMFPEQYENIFGEEFFNIDGWNEHWARTFQAGPKPGAVVFRKWWVIHLLDRKKAVPQWDELKDHHKKWSTDLLIYALYKYCRIGPEKLTPAVLRLLKPDSDHYFTAMGEYVASLKRKAKDIISRWKNKKDEQNHNLLMIPANGVFQTDITTWRAEHIHVFYRFFNQERYFNQVDAKKRTVALTHVLRVLNPGHPVYEQLITEYIFRYLETGFGHTINFNVERTKNRLMLLSGSLSSTAPPVPETVCGKPLGPLDSWSTGYVKELLKRKGVQIIEPGGIHYMSPLKQLDMLYDCDDESYRDGFLSLCRERECKFALIAVKRKSPRSKYVIRFRPIPGVIYDQKYANKHVLFFQYIHCAGMDCQKVYQQATSETLYECIRMIGPRYKGNVSQRELLAIALSRFGPTRNEQNRKVIAVAIRKVRGSLLGDLGTQSNKQLCSTLQPLGTKLQKKYEMLS